MFFKKEKDKDYDHIKKELEEDEFEQPRVDYKRPAREVPYDVREEMPTHREGGAPLFVKVDKYKELIASIHELKLYLGATKQVFALFNDLEAVRAESFNVLRATVQRLERTIVEMDSELLRPRGISLPTEDVAEVNHIENSLTDLHKQLMDLKRELGELK